jgi:hypothetical protein
MGIRLTVFAVALGLLLGGCFGYNRGAKKWAYVGNSVLILGGGGLVAADQLGGTSTSNTMPATGASPYDPPFSGLLLAGVVLASAGVLGMVFNATRPTVKTSR